jgi:bifunctional DNase/RNase
MKQMNSLVIGTNPVDGQQILFLSNQGCIIAMSISVSDAYNINMALNNISTVRPLTHQLLLNFANQVDRIFDHVVIDLADDGAFFAGIQIRRFDASNTALTTLIANPSDAVVVALRAKVPIFVTDKVVCSSRCQNSKPEETNAQSSKTEQRQSQNLNTEQSQNLSTEQSQNLSTEQSQNLNTEQTEADAFKKFIQTVKASDFSTGGAEK